jgi:hypothetical protein
MQLYIHVAIHALASMPSAPRLSEADSKTSTEVPCLYALRMPQAFCKNIAIALDTSALKGLSDYNSRLASTVHNDAKADI